MQEGRILRVFETEILCLMGNFETIPAIGIEIAPHEGGEPLLLGLLKGFTDLTPHFQDVVKWDDSYAEVFAGGILAGGILRVGRFQRQGIALIDIRECNHCYYGRMDFVSTPSGLMRMGKRCPAHWFCRGCGNEVYPKPWGEWISSSYARGDHTHRQKHSIRGVGKYGRDG